MADYTKTVRVGKRPFFGRIVVVCKSPEDFLSFSTSQAQFDDDGEPMTTATCGVGSLLARRYGDLRAVFAAHLPQSTKSKSTKLLRMPRLTHK